MPYDEKILLTWKNRMFRHGMLAILVWKIRAISSFPNLCHVIASISKRIAVPGVINIFQ